jgi:ADP-ribose pyrophosphatase
MPEILLTTRKFAVHRREYPMPGRPPVTREIVVHPGAVIVLPVLTDTTIVMIHNYRYTVEQELLELPAGTLEAHEAPAVCAARELEEETGYRAGRVEPMGQFYTSPGVMDELMRCYVAHDLQRTSQRLEGDERIRPDVVPLTQAIDWIRQGRIVDGKTIAVLLRYYLDRGLR